MKTLRRALPMFLLVSLPVLAQETPAGRDRADVRLEVFDVRDLVTEERPIEQLLRIAREEGRDGIRDAIPHGKAALVVRATPEALERIRLALKELRGNASVVITLETRFIHVGREHMLEELSLLAARSPTFLDDEGVAELLVELERRESAKTVSAPRISAFPGQKANIVIGRQVSYVKGYDVRKTDDGGQLADPVIDTLNVGMNLSVVAGEAFTDGGIDLDLDISLVEIPDPLPTRRIRIGDRNAVVEIQLPETTELRIARSLTLPEGKSALLSVGPLPFEEDNGARLLILLKATRTLLSDD